MEECKICGNEFKTKRGLYQHITRTEGLSGFEYYEKFNIGKLKKCKSCGELLTEKEFGNFYTEEKYIEDYCSDEKCIGAKILDSLRRRRKTVKNKKITKKEFIDIAVQRNLINFYIINRDKTNITEPITNKNTKDLSLRAFLGRNLIEDINNFDIEDYKKFYKDYSGIEKCIFCGTNSVKIVDIFNGETKEYCNSKVCSKRWTTELNNERMDNEFRETRERKIREKKEKTFICLECGERLKNGHGLGGHLRKHDLTHQEYINKYDLWIYTNCLSCEKELKFFPTTKNQSRKFCGNDCYWEHKRTHPEDYVPSEEMRKRQSVLMKEKIANGEFTPCVTNTWTKKGIYEFDGIKFRSSWEYVFYIYYKFCKNIILEYETIRIPYEIQGKNHNYIVDFKLDQTLIEIKPKCHLEDEKVKIKEKAAKKWCVENNMVFYTITEVVIEKILAELLERKILKKKPNKKLEFIYGDKKSKD